MRIWAGLFGVAYSAPGIAYELFMAEKKSKSDSEYLRYRCVRSMNRDAFLLNHGEMVHANDKLYGAIGMLAKRLRGKHDADGKTFVSFIPFLALMQRQVLSAFDHLASFQAYQAWMMVRPAIEIPLVMGKWIDEPAAAEIWMRRDTDPKAYQREYSGAKCGPLHSPVQTRFSR